MAIHWRVQFQSIGGTSYSVNIYDDSYSGSVVDLKGAAVPFETEEDTDNDIMSPVRTSTGYIRVINEGNLSGILPQNPQDRFVTLTSGASILWQGYMAQEQFSMPWDTEPYELAFPVISAMAILKGKQIVKGDIPARARVAEYLRLAISQCGATYDSIVLPWDIAETSSGATDVWLRLGLQDRNWFEYKNENVADKTASRYDGVSWLDMLSAILEAFGYTMYEQRTTLYIVGREVDSYHRVSTSELANFANNAHGASAAESSTNVIIQTLPLGGNDGKVDILLSSRRGVVEGDINKFDDDSVPVFNTYFLDYAATMNVNRQLSSGPGYYYSEKLAVYEPLSGSSIWTFLAYSAGAQVTWSGQNITQDYHMAAFCRTMDGENCLVINYNDLSGATGYGGTYTATVKSQSQSFLAGGHLRLEGNIDINEGTGATLHHEGVFMVRVGGLYYNAATNAWQSSPVSFHTSINDNSGEIGTLSTNNMGDESGYYIPLPENGIYGDVELYVYDPVSTSPLSTGVQATYVFTNMALSFVGPAADKFRDDPVTDTNRFVVELNAYAAEDKEKKISVTSYINERMGYGVLLKPDFSAPLQQIYWEVTRSTLYFEETLLDMIETHFKKPQRVLTLPIKSSTLYAPIDKFYDDNDYYRYLSVSKNWRDDHQEIKVIKTI